MGHPRWKRLGPRGRGLWYPLVENRDEWGSLSLAAAGVKVVRHTVANSFCGNRIGGLGLLRRAAPTQAKRRLEWGTRAGKDLGPRGRGLWYPLVENRDEWGSRSLAAAGAKVVRHTADSFCGNRIGGLGLLRRAVPTQAKRRLEWGTRAGEN